MWDSIRVGDRVQIKTNGGSPAARKHAGAEGRVRLVCECPDRTIFDVRIFGNNVDTVLEEGDLLAPKGGEKPVNNVGLLSGLECQSNLSQLLEELFGKNGTP
jgi:hypothetical protein